MSEIVVRDALGEEAGVVAAIQAEASLAALAHIFPPERYPFPHDAVRERWEATLDDAEARVLVAAAGDVAVGVSAVRPGWLDGLYVTPAWWGREVGPLLHDSALAALRDLGSTACKLWVLEENSRARRFYERRGWRENGETRVVPFPPNPLDVGYEIGLRDETSWLRATKSERG